MYNSLKKAGGRLILLLITLSLILSSITSCDLFSYVAGNKDEISSNINQSTSDGTSSHNYVSEYLRDWGMPIFDTIKFKYFEAHFNQLYNYSDGMPETLSHAKETADLFLEYYYDALDLDNKTKVTDALLYCYVSALDDPYSAYRPPVETDEYMTDMSGKFGGIGVMVEYNDDEESIMINTVYLDSPAEKAGVKVGDYIYAVDGKTVNELGYNNAVNHVRGEIGTPVELTLIRNGEYVTVTAIRAEVEEINVAYEIDTDTDIGYVQIVQFKKNTYSQFVDAIEAIEAAEAKGIVFDLRGNPGGYLDSVCDVISYLIPNGHTIVTYQYKGREMIELKSSNDSDDGDHVVDLPFVVICNQYTASAGEIFTAALRDYRNDGLLDATIVGTTTYKKGIMQNTYYYFDESTVTMTVAYYNPPCGENYHGKGVIPDITVENTDNDDIQLKVAFDEMIELINAN
nr:S41 family peptidase [Oscillospiraceae bacterium]